MQDEDTNLIDDQSPLDDQTDADQGDKKPEDSGLNKKSAEARINELISKTKELESKLKDTEAKLAPPPPPPVNTSDNSPEAQRIRESLKKLGFVTKEEQEKAVQAVEDRAVLNSEHLRLENRIDGSDGRPKYDRKEIEGFMRERGIYDAEVAYETKFKKELFDWNLKKYEESRKKKPFVQKPSSSQGEREDQTITREKIAEWLKTPEGRMKYEQNRPKIMDMMAKNQL